MNFMIFELFKKFINIIKQFIIIIQVNVDEWLYSFAKLATVDQDVFDKFITEYDTVVENRGKFSDFIR